MVKIFCGNGDTVPPGYNQLGTRYQCLQKGFGAGLYKSRTSSSVPWWSIAAIAAVAVLVLLMYYKRTKEKHQKLKYGRAY